jgi:hypothetical protein
MLSQVGTAVDLPLMRALQIKLTQPVQVNMKKYAKYLKLTGYKDIPQQVNIHDKTMSSVQSSLSSWLILAGRD